MLSRMGRFCLASALGLAILLNFWLSGAVLGESRGTPSSTLFRGKLGSPHPRPSLPKLKRIPKSWKRPHLRLRLWELRGFGPTQRQNRALVRGARKERGRKPLRPGGSAR